MRRITPILLLLLLSLYIAGCGAYGKRYEGGEEAATVAASDEKRITDERFDDAAREKDGCTDVQEFDSEGRTHTDSLDDRVDYKQNPPASGDHFIAATEWGLYDAQQQDEQTVHNLEHGHIVISYKGLSAKEREQLLDQVRINDYHLLVQPREENPKDGVYYTAWTAQVHCERPSEAALQYMIDNWRDQGPELFTQDTGGGDMGAGQKDD